MLPPVAVNGDGGAEKSLDALLAQWQSSSVELRASMDQLFQTLEEAGLGR
jgi:hypothetical protein